MLLARLPHGEGLPLPALATPGSAGYDLASADTGVLAPLERRLFRTGLAIAVPEGYECQIRPRSGLALKHGITLPNSPGTIDPDYRGELGIIVQNLGKGIVRLARGDRIAQLVFARFEAPRVEEVQGVAETARGGDGFGSTGRS